MNATALPASVAIPVRRGDRAVLCCLDCLAAQDFAGPFEVLLAMEAGDPLAGEVRRLHPRVRILESAKREPGGPRNECIEQARGRFIASTDADCLPRRDWLRRLVAAAERNPRRPVVGWVESPRTVLGAASELVERAVPRPRAPRLITGAWGSNLCIARDLLLASGARFAEGVFGAEEMALLAALPAPSRLVLLTPDAVVAHAHDYRWLTATRRMYRIGFGSARVRARHAARGAFLLRYPWLIPLLPAARLGLLFGRFLRHDPAGLGRCVLLLPLLCWFAAAQAAGFAAGARAVRAERETPSP